MEPVPFYSPNDIHKGIKEFVDTIPRPDPDAWEFHLPESQLPAFDNLNLNTAFPQPVFNEKQRLATDSDGNQNYLSPEQLSQVRKTGRFSVPSQDFPGQVYLWEINRGFQKGTDNIKESFKDGIAFGTQQYVVTIPNRIWKGDYITIWDSLKSIALGFINFIVVPIGGIDSTKTKVRSPDNMNRVRLTKVFDILDTQCQYDPDTLSFETDDGLVIRLFKPEDFKIPETFNEEYSRFLREIKIRQLNNRNDAIDRIKELSPNSTPEEIGLRVVNAEIDEQQQATTQFLKDKLDPDTAQKFIELMANIYAIRMAVRIREKERAQAVSDFTAHTKNKYWIRSRIPVWFSGKISDLTNKWEKDHPLLDYIRQYQAGYLLERNLEILDSKDYKKAENETARTPDEIFEWNFRIWRPSKWKITKAGTEDHPYYTIDKYNHYTTTSRYPGWRIANLVIRTGVIINNGAYWCLANAFYGPFGLRSLFGINEFQPDRSVNQKTGELEHTGTKFNTWFGRIKKLWQHIREARRTFKREPDTGFFGKSFTNPFNWVWNYIIKGVFGTLITFVGHPLLTLLSTPLSLIASLTSPVWGLGASMIKYLFDILIYDTDGVAGGVPLFRYLIWNILLRGVGQFTLSSLAVIGSSLLGVGSYIWAGLRAACRWSYDTTIYGLFIRSLGRVPQGDSWTARLVSGPGLGMNYYYQVDPETVRLLLMISLAKKEMNAYSNQETSRIEAPLKQYRDFLESFRNDGLLIDNEHATMREFTKNARLIKERLDNAIRGHWAKCGLSYTDINVRSCRMTKNDLAVVLENIADLCRDYYTSRIYNYMSPQDIYNLWFNMELVENDWNGLAKNHLKAIFGESILQPIEEVDNVGFRLEVQHLNAKKYFKQLWTGKINEDLEEVIQVAPVAPRAVIPNPTQILITPNDIRNGVHAYERYLYLTTTEYDVYKQKTVPEIVYDLN